MDNMLSIGYENSSGLFQTSGICKHEQLLKVNLSMKE